MLVEIGTMSVEIGEDDRKQAYFVLARRYLIWNAVTFVICLFCNRSSSRFSDYRVGEVGDIYRISLNPAGYAFSIWGIIYLGLCAFLCYHLVTVVKLYRQNESQHDIEKSNPNAQTSRSLAAARIFVDDIGIWFGVANLLNAAWIPVFVQATDLSVVIAAVILISLVSTLIRIQLGVQHWWRKLEVRAPFFSLPAVANCVPPTLVPGHKTEMSDDGITTSQNHGGSNTSKHRNDDLSIVVPTWELFLVDFTFSIYLGWTTAASSLNIQMVLEHVLFNSKESWLSLMITMVPLGIAFLINGVFYLWRQKNFAAALVFTWAATAIWVQSMKAGQCDEAPNFDKQKCNAVGITALALGWLIGGFAIFQLVNFILKVRAQGEETSRTQ
jgi:hypothetical protein